LKFIPGLGEEKLEMNKYKGMRPLTVERMKREEN